MANELGPVGAGKVGTNSMTGGIVPNSMTYQQQQQASHQVKITLLCLVNCFFKNNFILVFNY